ncbi:DNA replication complex GINS protein PSF2 [Conglomerata obtusa]
MHPSQLYLISQQENIEIEPTTHIQKFHLIQQDYGPFNLLEIHSVPIYIALLLKNSNMCRIRLPPFFEIENVKEILKNEEESEEYQPIHPYFFELRNIIKECYNVECYDEIMVYINTLKIVRFNKTNIGVKLIDARAINLNNLTCYEFNEVKTFLLKVMEEARELEK